MSTVTGYGKSETAYAWIRTRIGSQSFSPGYRLVLGSIAAELGMSVVPVREAIRRLEAEGLVSYERNIGARVVVIDKAEYAATMQTLGVVEAAATALSASRVTEADLTLAEEVNESLRSMLGHLDAQAFTELNRRFHTILFAQCPNPQLLDIVHLSWARLSSIRDSTFAFVPERARHSVNEHDELLRLIRSAASADAIERAARNHRWGTLDAFLHTRGTSRGEH